MEDSASSVAPIVRILDDDPQVLAYMANVARSLNYVVNAFEEPEAFMIDDADRPPDCLIVDWQLPGHNGLNVIAQCQKQWPETPAILVSGHVDVATTVAAMRQGVAGVLQKPIRREELAREIETAIARSRSRTIAAEERMLARQGVQKLGELELSILRLLVDGTPNKNIAIHMKFAIRTIEKYRRIIFDKLGVDSAAEATRIWVIANFEE